jgi:hypothetical protein
VPPTLDALDPQARSQTAHRSPSSSSCCSLRPLSSLSFKGTSVLHSSRPGAPESMVVGRPVTPSLPYSLFDRTTFSCRTCPTNTFTRSFINPHLVVTNMPACHRVTSNGRLARTLTAVACTCCACFYLLVVEHPAIHPSLFAFIAVTNKPGLTRLYR